MTDSVAAQNESQQDRSITTSLSKVLQVIENDVQSCCAPSDNEMVSVLRNVSGSQTNSAISHSNSNRCLSYEDSTDGGAQVVLSHLPVLWTAIRTLLSVNMLIAFSRCVLLSATECSNKTCHQPSLRIAKSILKSTCGQLRLRRVVSLATPIQLPSSHSRRRWSCDRPACPDLRTLIRLLRRDPHAARTHAAAMTNSSSSRL